MIEMNQDIITEENIFRDIKIWASRNFLELVLFHWMALLSIDILFDTEFQNIPISFIVIGIEAICGGIIGFFSDINNIDSIQSVDKI